MVSPAVTTLIIGGGVVIFAGFVSYGIQLRNIVKKRLRKKIDPGVAVALSAMPYTLILLILECLGHLLFTDIFPFPVIVYLTIVGWIGQIVFFVTLVIYVLELMFVLRK